MKTSEQASNAIKRAISLLKQAGYSIIAPTRGAETDVERRVAQIMVCQLGVDITEVQRTKNIVDDFAADSLDMVELIMAIEEEFVDERGIPDSAAEKFTTVGDVFDYCNSNYGASK